MKRTVTALLAMTLLAGIVGTPSALALSKSRAEHVVIQRIKARYFPPKGAFADCHQLSSKLFGCTYNYTSYSDSWCEGGAKVRQFPSGLAVSLGKPRAVIDNGGC